MDSKKVEAGRLGGIASREYCARQHAGRVSAYRGDPKRCADCSKVLPFEKRHGKFCDHTCSANHSNRQRSRKPVCPRCGNPMKKGAKRFCSRHCGARSRSEHLTREWLAGRHPGGGWSGVSPFVRKWLIQRDGEKCSLCGWDKVNPKTGHCTVQVDHIDGDPYRHRPENIRFLCPNCHTLTPTFGGANRGYGRKERNNLRRLRGNDTPYKR